MTLRLINEGKDLHHLFVKQADVWLNDDELSALTELLNQNQNV